MVVAAVALVAAACAPAPQPAPAKPAAPAQEKPAAAAQPAPAKPAQEKPAAQAQPAKPAAAAPGARVIRVGTQVPDKADALSISWVLSQLRDRLKQRSNGQLDMQIHWNGSLYSEVSAIKAMLDGAVDMSPSSVQNAGTFTKAFFVLDMPFLFDSYDELEKAVVLGPFNKRIKELVTKDQPNMLSILFSNTDGLRDIECSKKVVTPADLRGLKIRTTETPTDVAIWKALGATATPIAWAETYTAGTQNLIQCIGVGAGYWPINNKHYEWHKYITLIDYQSQVNVVHLSKKFFDSLSPEHQKLVMDTVAEVEKEAAKLDRQYTDKNLEALKTQFKQEIITLTPAQKKEWVDKAQPVYAEFKDRLPAGILDDLQSFLKTVR
ncbi:MAG: TRAP transporter substrate-binding protein [Chloroflexi bacterium]|nr:TRAP transporter substrate-binding protein [Chloroflexota bacterium]